LDLWSKTISFHALLTDDLGRGDGSSGSGFTFSIGGEKYQDSLFYTQKNDAMRGNIVYRTANGFALEGDWEGVSGHCVENTIFVAENSVNDHSENLTSNGQLTMRDNRFYGSGDLPDAEWMGEGNTTDSCGAAAGKEQWPDPDRTLKRYVQEELNLTLLEWDDDPYRDVSSVSVRSSAGEEYDPTGLKTFTAVATDMRRGGTAPPPASGKPSWTGDYDWDTRYTAVTVVNWVRAGFGMDPVEVVKPRSVHGTHRTPPFPFGATSTGTGKVTFRVHGTGGGKVLFELYNACGRLIHSIDGMKNSNGRFTATWTSGNRSGGISGGQLYIVVCRVDGVRQGACTLPHVR
jgi:hypothetical protein